jgi:hypothetical protein
LFFIETEIHNNNTGTMSSKKRESSINTRRTPNPQRSDSRRERSSQAVQELTIVIDKKDVTHIERSRALTLALNDRHGRNIYTAGNQALLKLNAQTPLVSPHDEVRHNGVNYRALTQLSSGETTPRGVSSDWAGRLGDSYGKGETIFG